MTQKRVMSLRMRLFLLILSPLILVALLLGYWRYTVAQDTAEELFDRSLLSTGLAILRDVAISEGDALSLTTRDLIRDATGGELFYHVTGPGGIYVTGYAYPPRLSGTTSHSTPLYGLARYRGELVRALRITERTSIGNLVGDTTVTVWQRTDERQQLATSLALRAGALMLTLLVCLALLVWFGVNLGLRPLRDLHAAIAERSPDDLRRIGRPMPIEMRGVVATLNRLFGQVETSIEARQAFISDAAHQLRNPSAAILSMAETLEDANDPKDRQIRTRELVEAARSSARLTNQLLSFERLRHDDGHLYKEAFDLRDAAEEASLSLGGEALNRGIELDFEPSTTALPVFADRVMVVEAIRNLLDNALQHGGPTLDRIGVATTSQDGYAAVTIADTGRGMDPALAEAAMQRFRQLEPGSGSGLGMAIARTVAEHHGGQLTFDALDRGASFTLTLPLQTNVPDS